MKTSSSKELWRKVLEISNCLIRPATKIFSVSNESERTQFVLFGGQNCPFTILTPSVRKLQSVSRYLDFSL
jgi:hypothetical protein